VRGAREGADGDGEPGRPTCWYLDDGCSGRVARDGYRECGVVVYSRLKRRHSSGDAVGDPRSLLANAVRERARRWKLPQASADRAASETRAEEQSVLVASRGAR
jgi:hypothetical protein